jgi:hypothetical protein
MDMKKRFDIQSSARGGAHDALPKWNTGAVAPIAANDKQQKISVALKTDQTLKTDHGKGGDVSARPFAPNPTSTLLPGDCIEMMRCHVADNSVDVVIADVPYFLRQPDQPSAGDVIETSGSRDRFAEHWDQYDDIDAYERFCVGWIDEAMRVLDLAGSLFILGTFHNIGLINRILQIKKIEILGHIVWLKRDSAPHLAGRRLASSHETVLWRRNRGVIGFVTGSARLQFTQAMALRRRVFRCGMFGTSPPTHGMPLVIRRQAGRAL